MICLAAPGGSWEVDIEVGRVFYSEIDNSLNHKSQLPIYISKSLNLYAPKTSHIERIRGFIPELKLWIEFGTICSKISNGMTLSSIELNAIEPMVTSCYNFLDRMHKLEIGRSTLPNSLSVGINFGEFVAHRNATLYYLKSANDADYLKIVKSIGGIEIYEELWLQKSQMRILADKGYLHDFEVAVQVKVKNIMHVEFPSRLRMLWNQTDNTGKYAMYYMLCCALPRAGRLLLESELRLEQIPEYVDQIFE
jgi:hypothetical protein